MDYYEIETKSELLEKYKSDIVKIDNMFGKLSKEQLLFRPDIQDTWTINDHLIHISETEINCFLRFKQARLNPGAVIDFGGGDVEKSNILLDYNNADPQNYISLFMTLRRIVSEETEKLSEQEMEEKYIIHLDFGKCNIKFILSIYTQHIEKHITMIKRNLSLFK